jgi:sulfotransferase
VLLVVSMSDYEMETNPGNSILFEIGWCPKDTDRLHKHMPKQYHFVCGLPRSGSTLLCALLNQNPKFHAGASSPVLTLLCNAHNLIEEDELMKAYPDPPSSGQLMKSIIDGWYLQIPENVVFEKNRNAHSCIDVLNCLDDTIKYLCTYRDVSEILTSFISMLQRNNYPEGNIVDSQLTNRNIEFTDDNRCSYLSGSDGVLGIAALQMVEVLTTHPERLFIVDYADLVESPEKTMRQIYTFLDIQYFPHNFQDIGQDAQENDEQVYKLKDMHAVHSSVRYYGNDPRDVLSPGVIEGCNVSPLYNELAQLVDLHKSKIFPTA